MNIRMTYADAAERLGSRDSRKVANNTYLVRHDEETIALRLHATDVLTFRPGTVTLDSGGWRTVTTKDRLNYAVSVFSKRGTWYVGGYGDEQPVVYFDGIVFNNDGTLAVEPVEDPTAEADAMKRRIAAFVKLVGETFDAGMPVPSGGDCWFCAMRTTEGETLGDLGDHDHLLDHMDEGYVVPSLLVNAVVEKGYNVPAYILGVREDGTMGGRYGAADLVKSAVRDYLKRRLIPGQTGGRPVAGPNRAAGFAVR